MKSPPIQYHDDEAREMVERFIRETADQRAAVEVPTDD
jgi:myo-inositol-1-phosphate synthase